MENNVETESRLISSALLLDAMVGAFEHVLSEMTDIKEEELIKTMFEIREMQDVINRNFYWVIKNG